MSEKPRYLGLLNAIANGEAQAHEYLTAWIDTTDDPHVRDVLSTVAAREGEHGMAFAKRIDELGYSVRRSDDDSGGSAKRMRIATSDRSDLEKMEAFGLDRLDTQGKPDVFDTIFSDHSIDIATGALLGRYIAEERDSARLLRGCYEALKANDAARAASPPTHAADDRLASLEAKLDAVCAALGHLETVVGGASAARPSARNGAVARGRSSSTR